MWKIKVEQQNSIFSNLNGKYGSFYEKEMSILKNATMKNKQWYLFNNTIYPESYYQ